ncbi:glycerate kinase type-2 family protein [Celeribacter sp.]|uniref:glycerate kinase type-2 family protein n=1 Tax=Celeribacter sp. TaxID=1890673 RepID=UPI003A94BD84
MSEDISRPDETRAPRALITDIFQAGVAAADPAAAVKSALAGQAFERPVIIAVGKAARTMAAAAMEHVTADTVVVVTNYENAEALEGAEVRAAAHPVPDANGARAALRVEEVLSHATDDVLALISGGGSALLPAPVAGVSLEEKAEVNKLLLASGADIVTMNLVRQQLSRLKGGGLLRAAAPATVTTLVLSDVVTDDTRAIASGPTVSPIGSRADAAQVLKDYDIWDRVAPSVRAHLERPEPDLGPLPESPLTIVGSNARSVEAMAEAARERAAGAALYVHPTPVEGDVSEAAEVILEIARAQGGKGLFLFGGETTVKIKGDGLGGRNQELALRVAMLAQVRGIEEFAFLSGGTDGRDGPTDAAGGLVDHSTLARMREMGVEPEESLSRNDSHHALDAAGDLLRIGATGTNVADLQVLWLP